MSDFLQIYLSVGNHVLQKDRIPLEGFVQREIEWTFPSVEVNSGTRIEVMMKASIQVENDWVYV